MGLGNWISAATGLAGGGKLLDTALSQVAAKNSPVRQMGEKLVDRLLDKMSSRSGSFNQIFNKATSQVNADNSSHFVRQLPAVKPLAYGALAAELHTPNTPMAATNPITVWNQLETFDTNQDQQLDQTELANALTELDKQQASQITQGASPQTIHQTETLHKFVTGLQHYHQTIAAFDQHQQGISANDLQQLAALNGDDNRIQGADWRRLNT